MEKKIKFKFLKKIYIIILKNIFNLINGKFSVSNQEKKFIIDEKKFRKKKYKIFQIKDGKIYLDSSEEKYFYIKKNSIFKKLSIDTKKLDKNTNILKFGITKLLKKKNLNVVSIISGRDAKNNYYHWLIDVLPRLLILEEKIQKNNIKNILVPNYQKKYQLDSLKCFFKKNNMNFINLSQNKYLKFKSIIFSSNDIGFDFYNLHLLKKLKKRVFDYMRENRISSKHNFSRIYINRLDANLKKNRYLINENELISELKKKGFRSITLSDYSFFDQALIFYNAKLIIGLHGAGLANILFAKKKTKIIELTNSNWPNIYDKLSKCLGLNYRKVLCNNVKKNSNTLRCSIRKVLIKI